MIYPKVSETRTLDTDILNQDSLDSKLVLKSVNLNTDKVVIKGAEHRLKEVSTVKALVDIENLISQEEGTVKLNDIPLVKSTGVDGFFVVSAVCSADDPYQSARALVEAWNQV